MPSWFGKKSSKHKEENQQSKGIHQSPQGNNHSSNTHFGFLKSPAKNDSKRPKDKPKSFDEVLTRGSPRLSREFAGAGAGAAAPGGGSSSGFSGFDSDGSRCHPLPRPSVSSTPSLGNEHGVGLGSGSASVSSESSSGSSEDHPIGHENGQFGAYRLVLRGSLAFGKLGFGLDLI